MKKILVLLIAIFVVSCASLQPKPIPTRGAVAVTVMTYTPSPSATQTTTPEPTATLPPATLSPTHMAITRQPPTPPMASTATALIVPGLSGSVVYGAHVLNPTANAGLVSKLGMGLVKLQVRWADMADCGGANYSGLDGQIGAIRAAGLRVLLSVVTAPPCSNSAGSQNYPPDNLQTYADFVTSLVGRYGASVWGVEVWNEENLDREWGVPDPARYVDLLRLTYQSVKAANPSVVVITGAPAPTWHNPPSWWDDVVFYQAVAQEGGGQYADCIGTHVNSLTFPPDAKSTDGIHSVGGNTHHSWYFYDTVWDYWNAFGGTMPICITEFGVASPGAVGGVPPGFEWANPITLEEQAAWLVQGMQLAESWGNVKAVIVWNLDFSPECGGCVDEKSPYSILSPTKNPLPAYVAIEQALAH